MASVIPSTWEVPAAIVSRFGTQAGRQRAMLHEGHLVLVLHLAPEPGSVERTAAIFWRKPDGSWKSTREAAGGLAGLKQLLATYRERVNALETQAEHAQRAADYFAVLHAVGPTLRAARNLHATLQEARDGLKAERELIALRDEAYAIERTADIVYGDAKNGLDFCIARQGEEQAAIATRIAEASHRLNLVTAMFLPITAIGAVFGINLVSGLETTSAPWLFWGFVAAAFVLGLVVRGAVEGKKRG